MTEIRESLCLFHNDWRRVWVHVSVCPGRQGGSLLSNEETMGDKIALLNEHVPRAILVRPNIHTFLPKCYIFICHG